MHELQQSIGESGNRPVLFIQWYALTNLEKNLLFLFRVFEEQHKANPGATK
jgi:hypothetical protein